MARWTTVDPLGMVDGPNMYGYVMGDPINSLDIYGRQCGFGFFSGVLIGGFTLWELARWGFVIGTTSYALWKIIKAFRAGEPHIDRMNERLNPQVDPVINEVLRHQDTEDGVDTIRETIRENLRYTHPGVRARGLVGGSGGSSCK